MKKIPIAFGMFMFCSLHVSAQVEKGEIERTKIPEPRDHYEPEYAYDSTTDAARWANEKPGLHVSFASTDRHYFRSEVPDIAITTGQQITGWRGERVNALILIWSPDTLNQVRLALSDLTDPKGRSISKKNMQLNLLRYVVSNYPYNARNAVCDASPYKNVYLMPDRFEAFERFDLPGKSLRPVWLSVDIPADAEPGAYRGTIEVKDEKHSVALQLSIRVQKQLLPPPHEWKYRLDLWQNPWVIAWYNHVQPWSEAHKVLLKQHLKRYADAGGKWITTYAVHSPWSDNSYMIEGAMIEWIKKQNGSWKFDYSIFDEYVQLAMDLGIDKAITIYTPIPWGNRFRYLDERTGNYVYAVWPPGSAEFNRFWNIFLTDLQAHLIKKGWFGKTYIGINENPLEQTMAAINMVKAHSKKWKITYAGDWHPELDILLNDYCFLYGKEPDVEQVKKRSARGFTSTYYVCCNPPKPNDFVFSPPAEGVWLSWYAAAHGYNGFLRWAYDAWPADPARDARHTLWPAGDCFLVYPGGSSCSRFEKLREGIADYEKIRILKELASRSSDKKVKALMKELNDHLNAFVAEHDFDTAKITADLDKGRKLLEALSDSLAQ